MREAAAGGAVPYYSSPSGDVTLYQGDALAVLRALPAGSVDAVVTDPPYGLGFMGKEWDSFSPGAVADRAARKARKESPVPDGQAGPLNSAAYVEYDYSARGLVGFQRWCETWGRECLQVLKPGGYLVAFGSPRTYHRLTCGLEDAGFAIKDSLLFLHGQGFPKSLDVERAIALATCALPGRHFARALPPEERRRPGDHVCPPTLESIPWAGFGSALKPAYEPIVLAQKPLDGTYTANVTRWGVGGLNVDACRIGTDRTMRSNRAEMGYHGGNRAEMGYHGGNLAEEYTTGSEAGRWPANVLLDDAAAALLDAQSGVTGERARILTRNGQRRMDGWGLAAESRGVVHGDTGGASRFYFCAKASRTERNAGLDGLTERPLLWSAGTQNPGSFQSDGTKRAARNHHPTVKPLAVCAWLVRLVTPAVGVVLDPFMGSGSIGCAAVPLGYCYVGIERETEYLPIATARIRHWAGRARQAGLDLGAAAGG